MMYVLLLAFVASSFAFKQTILHKPVAAAEKQDPRAAAQVWQASLMRKRNTLQYDTGGEAEVDDGEVTINVGGMPVVVPVTPGEVGSFTNEDGEEQQVVAVGDAAVILPPASQASDGPVEITVGGVTTVVTVEEDGSAIVAQADSVTFISEDGTVEVIDTPAAGGVAVTESGVRLVFFPGASTPVQLDEEDATPVVEGVTSTTIVIDGVETTITQLEDENGESAAVIQQPDQPVVIAFSSGVVVSVSSVKPPTTDVVPLDNGRFVVYGNDGAVSVSSAPVEDAAAPVDVKYATVTQADGTQEVFAIIADVVLDGSKAITLEFDFGGAKKRSVEHRHHHSSSSSSSSSSTSSSSSSSSTEYVYYVNEQDDSCAQADWSIGLPSLPSALEFKDAQFLIEFQNAAGPVNVNTSDALGRVQSIGNGQVVWKVDSAKGADLDGGLDSLRLTGTAPCGTAIKSSLFKMGEVCTATRCAPVDLSTCSCDTLTVVSVE